MPTEILQLILRKCVNSDPSQRFILEKVSKQFREIVNTFPLPEIYLDPSILPQVPTVISVRRLVGIYGRFSGVTIEIRRIINNNKWFNAWMELSEGENRWFSIQSIYLRRRDDRHQ